MKIGIIGAMELEISLIKEEMREMKEEVVRGFRFWRGKIGKNEVFLLQSGIGKVSAGVGTGLLIDRYNPDLVINTGVAGGLKGVRVYDMVLAERVFYHDVDVTAFGYKMGQQAQMPAYFTTNEAFRKEAMEVIKSVSGKAVIGDVASGDSFIHSKERREWIEENFGSCVCVEMESAAIAQVCYMMGVNFLIIRSISDVAGEENTVSYDKFVEEAGRISGRVNVEIVKRVG